MKYTYKHIIFFLFVFALLPFFTINAQDSLKTKNKGQDTQAKIKHGPRFVDKDGDGFNDNAPDHDGDGIPNGLDPDYQGQGKKKHFVDLDGDGINDTTEDEEDESIQKGFGPKGKSANQGMSQQNGTGKQKGKGKKSGN